jgi:hypothetical protein
VKKKEIYMDLFRFRVSGEQNWLPTFEEANDSIAVKYADLTNLRANLVRFDSLYKNDIEQMNLFASGAQLHDSGDYVGMPSSSGLSQFNTLDKSRSVIRSVQVPCSGEQNWLPTFEWEYRSKAC